MPVPYSQPSKVRLSGYSDPESPAAVGILGGTFDPVHHGHLAIATAAVQQAQLDQLLWVPDPHPPHKAKSAITALDHRINMIQCAIAPFPRQQVWQMPQDNAQAHESSAPSFAIATLNALQQTQPNCRWHWILGLDAFSSLPKWYRSENLVDQCQWIVAPRSDAVGQSVIDQCEQVVAYFASCDRVIQYQLLDLTAFQPIPAASSLIRQRYQTSLPRNQINQIDQWLPTAVQHYIQQHQLY